MRVVLPASGCEMMAKVRRGREAELWGWWDMGVWACARGVRGESEVVAVMAAAGRVRRRCVVEREVCGRRNWTAIQPRGQGGVDPRPGVRSKLTRGVWGRVGMGECSQASGIRRRAIRGKPR